jgi:fructose 1,6-bisphosphate aldolase/phosphatase
MTKVTISIIKADVGGWPGHATVHPKLMEIASNMLSEAKEQGTVLDFHVTHCGDDLELIMSHAKGDNNKYVHETAWNIFTAATNEAKVMKLYGAGLHT